MILSLDAGQLYLILNNRLKWDGTHLGSYPATAMRERWRVDNTRYYTIVLPQGWSPTLPGGLLYSIALCTTDTFSCIVEGIKEVFGIARRGVHRITIGWAEYILYYVPISERGEAIWETPLSRLDQKHQLRKDESFRKEVQRTIAFCDILALSSTGEPQLRIRPHVNGGYIPISFNETSTVMRRNKGNETYGCSILSKTLFTKWFGEETSINDIVKEMTYCCSGHEATSSNLAIICADIRGKVDKVIRRYDPGYIWYTTFIVERMSRHLLIDS